MAVLDEMVVVAPNATTADITIDDVKAAIARQLWGWFYAHANDVLISQRVLLWKVNIRVRDLEILFVTLLGKPDAH
jgi:hypothetical protein